MMLHLARAVDACDRCDGLSYCHITAPTPTYPEAAEILRGVGFRE